ncbi:hypothetical protein HPB51_008120 [Rhipicephalus microplus]|uniref:BESS domain-containing protein n=1 Tax=Rhipicephalus microplus TaxID=6941 RepID=A0A9J6EMT5_RHIMP|nr:hypothetical protein HPB51_008120 [Rhipicephalus microplus]
MSLTPADPAAANHCCVATSEIPPLTSTVENDGPIPPKPPLLRKTATPTRCRRRHCFRLRREVTSRLVAPGAPVRPASQVQAARQPPRPDSPTTSIGMNVQELLQDMVQFEDQCLELSEASAHSDDDASGPSGVVCPYAQERTAPEPAVADGSAESTPTQRRSRKRKNEEELDSITQNVQDLCETLKKTESRNEHEYFGLCLAKYLEKIPEKRQLELKVKIMQLVMEYVD